MSVRTRRTDLGPSVGSYGWPGKYSTAWYNDPAEDMVTILMVQRVTAPPGPPIHLDLWTAAYQAIDD
jgi:CubicO group peptidase (beta-lactamase class C family)